MSIIEEYKNAILCGNAGKLHSLIENYPENCDSKYDKGKALTMLHLAAEKGTVEILELLLVSGCSPNNQDCNGETALHKAATVSNIEKCRLLIEWDANPKLPSNEGYLAFNSALNGKNEELVSFLREKTYESS